MPPKATKASEYITKLGFVDEKDKNYKDWVSKFKTDFIGARPDLAFSALKAAGNLKYWYDSIEDIYKMYPVEWNLANWKPDHDIRTIDNPEVVLQYKPIRSAHAHAFLIAQTKKTRVLARATAADLPVEPRGAKRKSPEPETSTEETRALKVRKIEYPTLEYPMLICVQRNPQIDGYSRILYQAVSDFTELLKRVRDVTGITGKLIISGDVPILSEVYSELLGLKIGKLAMAPIYNQRSWDTAVIEVQNNYLDSVEGSRNAILC